MTRGYANPIPVLSVTLILTESPGTARRLQDRLPSACGLGDMPVCMATLGYVLVPPDTLHPLALRLDDAGSLQEDRIVRHPDVLRRILVAAQQADHIVLATDPDEEGEVIAQDLAMIFTESGLAGGKFGDVPATRLRLYGLDDASIRDACKDAESVHLSAMATAWPLALPGHTRRMMDRWIAGSLGSPEQPVGRVIAGFLEAAQRDERYVVPTLALAGCSPSGAPAHLGDLLLADELMDTSVQGITGALQGLYEAGRVSYPRTDSHDLVARHQHSHTALHLLGTPSQKAEIRDMAYMEPPRMPLETRILCAVARREMAATGEDVFPPKAAQAADPVRHLQNLRERAVLRVLLAQGLGRPSTWTAFATRHAGWMTPCQGATHDGRLSPQGIRMAAHQPEGLGLPFQRAIRTFLEGLAPCKGLAPGTGLPDKGDTMAAGRHAVDALQWLDEASQRRMMESIGREPGTERDWRDDLRKANTPNTDFGLQS